MSLKDRLFPDLRSAKWGYVNLNDYAMKHFSCENFPNPLLDAIYCDKWIQSIHKNEGLGVSYGGYGEDRHRLWRGSYLHLFETIHLGIDYNVPAGTSVHVPCDCKLVSILDDLSPSYGWGLRLIFEVISSPNLFFVLSHLCPAKFYKISRSTTFKQGSYIGEVGESWMNGGWYPHLHVQMIDGEIPVDFDGYGTYNELTSGKYPNPNLLLNF